MSDLSPDTRALLARVSAGDRPSAADHDRVLAMIGGALAAPIVPTPTAAGTAGTAGTVATGGAVKVVLAFVLAVGAGGVGVAAATSVWRASRPAPVSAAPVAAPLPPIAPAPIEPAPPPVEPAPEAAAAPIAEVPVPRAPRPPRVERAPSPPPAPAPVATPEVEPAKPPGPVTRRDDGCELSAELTVLQQAQQALKANPAQAAAGLDTFSARCPTGALLEERLATRALALCANGDQDQGRAAAQELSQQFPASPSLARVTQACPR